jgi:hypothetical protein
MRAMRDRVREGADEAQGFVEDLTRGYFERGGRLYLHQSGADGAAYACRCVGRVGRGEGGK